MKRHSIARFALTTVCALGVAATMSVRADTIGLWTFETGSPSAVPTAWNGTVGFQGTTPGQTFPSDVSTYGSGSASGLHVSTSSMWVGPAGDGSVRALSVNNWAQLDYYQLALTPDLVNYTFSGINVAWDQTGSATGPKTWYLAYSTDGSTFTQFGADYALTAVTWNSSTYQSGNHQAMDLSAVTGLNTASTMYFRIVEDSPIAAGAINGGNVGTGGTGRIDNFTITATVTAVPEPASLALLGGFGGLLVWNMIRRRR